ncbi:MAG: transposase [Acetivibrionales bacterium]|jgi:putative transposase
MPRIPRKISDSGVYHIMVRGINKQDIFQDKEDRIIFLKKLKAVKERSECKVYAYCLMSNHVHLLIAEGKESIGQIMKRLGTAYAYWYNNKYDRVGHLFQGRFRSEPVNVDTYLLAALRYIHQNPVKAGITLSCNDYTWSSYHEYIDSGKQTKGITDTGLGLDIAGSLKQFTEFHQEHGSSDMIDIEDTIKITDMQAEKLINEVLAGKTSSDISQMKKVDRNRLIRDIKALPGVSQKQIMKVTGLSRNIIQRA